MKKTDRIAIGLTGGICSGKSTASKIFRELGIKVIEVDKVAKYIVKPGSKILKRITCEFGKKILNKNGTLKRKELARVIFSNEGKRKKLNRIIHPEIISEIKSRIKKFKNETVEKIQQFHPERSEGSRLPKKNKILRFTQNDNIRRYLVVDAPLLFEAKIENLFDKIVLVYVPGNIQIERLIKREKITYRDAVKRIKSQIPISKKRKHADFIIYGNFPLMKMRKEVKSFLKKILD